jgi:hypothetical protein
MNVIGGRKVILGLVYLLGSFVMIGMSIQTKDSGVVASVAGACIALAPGLGMIIWGNVKVHETNLTKEA